MPKTTTREGRVELAPRFARLMRASGRDLAVSMPVIALLRADGRLTAAIERAVAPALTIPQFSVLMELAAAPSGRLSLCEVGRRCLKSPPNITSIVDRLESAGLVRRIRDDSDRRVVLAEITDSGWEALDLAAPRVFAAEREALEGLAPTERAALSGLLDRVAR